MTSEVARDRERLVFVFTDASYCSRTGASGWACCIITPSGERTISGPLGKRVTRSSDAERCAILHGIAFAISEGYIGDGKEVTLYTDHGGLLPILERPGNGALSHRLHDYLHRAMREHGFSLELRHVKSHVRSNKREIQHQINTIVDRLARDRMLEGRKAILERCREMEQRGERHESSFAPAAVA